MHAPHSPCSQPTFVPVSPTGRAGSPTGAWRGSTAAVPVAVDAHGETRRSGCLATAAAPHVRPASTSARRVSGHQRAAAARPRRTGALASVPASRAVAPWRSAGLGVASPGCAEDRHRRVAGANTMRMPASASRRARAPCQRCRAPVDGQSRTATTTARPDRGFQRAGDQLARAEHAAAGELEARVERLERRGKLGVRVGVRDRAADRSRRASIAGWPTYRRAWREQRPVLGDDGAFERRLAHGGADPEHAVGPRIRQGCR